MTRRLSIDLLIRLNVSENVKPLRFFGCYDISNYNYSEYTGIMQDGLSVGQL